MVKTQICLSALATAALCSTNPTNDYMSIIRKNPSFLLGDWQVGQVTPSVNSATNNIQAPLPTGNVTFSESTRYKTYMVSTRWEPESHVKSWNENKTGLVFHIPSASSYDDNVAQGQTVDEVGRTSKFDNLKVMQNDSKNLNVSFTLSYAESEPSDPTHWTHVNLSKFVPIDSIHLVNVSRSSGPFDPLYDKKSAKFFLGRWVVSAPFSEHNIGKSMCCIPIYNVEISEDLTNHSISHMDVNGWFGQGCGKLDMGDSDTRNVDSNSTFPQANFEEFAAKPFQTDFKKLVISAKNYKEIVHSDGSVHETFELTTDFTAYSNSTKACSVTLRGSKPLKMFHHISIDEKNATVIIDNDEPVKLTSDMATKIHNSIKSFLK